MKLLILGTAILAAGELTETADSVEAPDAIYPKHVIEGWQVVDFAPADLPADFAPASYTLVNGVLVKKPPAPLSDAERAAVVEAINKQRDIDVIAGVEWNGKHWHTDDRFLTELLGMLMGYQVGLYSGTQTIRTRDNTNEQLGAAEITALAAAVGAYRKAVYAASWAAKDAL